MDNNQDEVDEEPYSSQSDIGCHYRPNLGFERYYPTLKSFRRKKIPITDPEILPIDHVGVFSYVTCTWLTNLLWSIYRNGSSAVKNYQCPLIETCLWNTNRLEHYWKKEQKDYGLKNASLARVIERFLWTRMWITVTTHTIVQCLGFLTPTIFIFKLLEYLKNHDEPLSTGITTVVVIFLVDILKVVANAFVWSMYGRTAVRLRSAVLGLLIRNILSQHHGLEGKSVGEIINLFANDGARLYDYASCGYLWVPGLVTTVLATVFVFWSFGTPSYACMAVFIVFYGIQYVVARLMAYFRRKAVTASDQRVRQITEILTSIKVIKLCAWEEPFTNKITELRNTEKSFLEKKMFCQSIMSSFSSSIPIVAAIATFLTAIAMGYKLEPTKIYPSLGAIMMARTGLMLLLSSISKRADYQSSVLRLQTILLNEYPAQSPKKPDDPSIAIKFENASYTWTVPCSIQTTSAETNGVAKVKPSVNRLTPNGKSIDEHEKDSLTRCDDHISTLTLRAIDLSVKKGQLVGICGTVGSGKSSLLSAILGKIHLIKGSCSSKGSFSYVPQQAWVMNATVRENILFGSDFDADRFQTSIKACALDKEIADMAGGDQTEIGERGVNLSGGQKQRISIARAVYSDCDNYLLDDPLSAVDHCVGSHIFRECIKGLLASKTIIFVSHQIQYLDQCDYVIMVRDGQIIEHGQPQTLTQTDGEYSTLAKSFHSNKSERKDDESKSSACSTESEKLLDGQQNDVGKSITTKEVLETGKISMSTYCVYVRAMGGVSIAITIFLLIGLTVSFTSFSNWWLSRMLSESSNHRNVTVTEERNNVGLYDKTNVIIYSLFLVAIFVAATLKSFAYVMGTLHASTVLQQTAVRNVILSPMRLFETVPLGQIINVFSKDQDEVDTMLPLIMEEAVVSAWLNAITLIIIVLVFPLFLIPLTVIIIIFLIFTAIFQAAQRELKRVENRSRSPFFGHIGAIIHGLATIQVYEKEKDFEKAFMKLQDENSSIQILMWSCFRWLSLRLDILSVLITTITATFVVLTRGEIPTAFAGLTLTFSCQLCLMVHYFVKNLSDTQARFTNVERINRYCENHKYEGSEVTDILETPLKWPSSGQIIFEDVQMRYRERLPLALSNVSFSVEAGEKIGIVGRTGSGKSSLGVALFRLVELCGGKIVIDGVDIARLRLKDLRSRLSMIPQDPVLFIGTVRYNLDPLEHFTDEAVWNVLERTHLKDKISTFEQQLLAPVAENGENFSVGERQLLCLARALLRHSKIIILDEATASVDTQTDHLIQEIIQEAFRDCTILTVAHRVQTVSNYDRILVMHQGKVLEWDTSDHLKENYKSHYSKLLRESS